MSTSQKVCFEYPLNEPNAGLLAIVENNFIQHNISARHSNIILAPIYKVGDEAEGFESGITQIGAAFLVISSDGFYLGLFKSAASADNCYATALILEESLAKMYSKN